MNRWARSMPQRGRAIQLEGVTGAALQTLREQAILIVRSHYLMPVNPLASNQRQQILEEMKQ